MKTKISDLMKIENSTWDFCKNSTLQNSQLKLDVNWNFNPTILMKDNFIEDSIKIKGKLNSTWEFC